MDKNRTEGKCKYCGVDIKLEKTSNSQVWNDVTKHSEWCDKFSIDLNTMFNKTYAEVYNIIELALDKTKAEKAKALIGKSIHSTYQRCMDVVANYFNTKE